MKSADCFYSSRMEQFGNALDQRNRCKLFSSLFLWMIFQGSVVDISVTTLSKSSELPNTYRNRSNQQASLLLHNLLIFNPILQENRATVFQTCSAHIQEGLNITPSTHELRLLFTQWNKGLLVAIPLPSNLTCPYDDKLT